jgi:PAS domain S-box-containing protein
MIIDRNGTIIFHSDPSYEGKKFIEKDVLSSIETGNAGIYSIIENGDDTYSAVVPFGDNLDHSEYAVVVCSPARIINGKIIKLINRSNAVLFSTFGLGAILLLVILTTMLTNPLAIILNTMKDITKTRDLKKRVNIKTDDEISEIADAFNTMTADLQNTTTSVDNLNREIAERKKVENDLRNSETRFKQIANNAVEWIWEIDTEGLYTYSSPVTEKLLGYKPEEIVAKKHFYDLFVEKDRDKLKKAAFDAFAQKQFFKGFLNANVHREGRIVWLMTSGVPILDDDDNLIGYRGSDIDITERKEAEETMKQLNVDLEKAVTKLEDANQEMKNFVYIASHDLREPLRKVAAFGEMLQKSLEGKLSEEDAENLHYMIDGTQRMNSMIEDLLVYSRVNTKTQPPETVDLNEILKQLRQLELSIILQEKQVILEVPQSLPFISADPDQMRQLMQNLITNGIKYQSKGNIPRVTITSKPAVNGMVRIEISDNGIGIKAEFQQSIFVMFKRLHSRGEYEGTGIGLAVCRKIVERHGGQIGVESEYGKGSTFWFTMPATAKAVVAGIKLKSEFREAGRSDNKNR